MADIDKIKAITLKIYNQIKNVDINKEKENIKSLSELYSMIAQALADEENGTDTYEKMRQLATDSTGALPESTVDALLPLFLSMSRDEQKHHEILEALDKFSEKYKTAQETKKSYTFQIAKQHQDRQIAFGFAMFSETADGKRVVDLQGDSITPEELESLAYNYVAKHRDVGQLHMTSGEGCVVESMVFTRDKIEALGLGNNVPIAWWVGLYIEDPEVWARVKNGEYRAFSIEGVADREEVEISEG